MWSIICVTISWFRIHLTRVYNFLPFKSLGIHLPFSLMSSVLLYNYWASECAFAIFIFAVVFTNLASVHAIIVVVVILCIFSFVSKIDMSIVMKCDTSLLVVKRQLIC